MLRSTTLVAIGLCVALAATATPSYAATAQQEKMTRCNAEASSKALAGDERKSYMKECLSAKASKPLNSQQEKMKSCNKEAKSKGLKGAERKQFMSDCLKAG